MKMFQYRLVVSVGFLVFVVTSVVAMGARTAHALSPVAAGLLKSDDASAVYYLGANGKRYVFPTEKTYKTWYTDFSSVRTVSKTELATYPIGGNVTYRPGVKMVKIESAPQVYVVAKGGVLRWITSEAVARALYGEAWNTMIEDVPDAFFTNYTMGADVVSAGDFTPSAETAAAGSIGMDKNLEGPSGY
jgi:hypothetical protein